MASIQVTVPFGATPTNLLAGLSHSGDSSQGDTLVIFNADTVTVGLGDSTVTSGTMFRALTAGAVLTLDVKPGDQLYGLVPSGSVNGSIDILRVA